jgi:hypothetical protein
MFARLAPARFRVKRSFEFEEGPGASQFLATRFLLEWSRPFRWAQMPVWPQEKCFAARIGLSPANGKSRSSKGQIRKKTFVPFKAP